jgi:nucleoside transporter
MMFLQYMVWCMWQVKLGTYLVHLDFNGDQIGMIFGAFYFACLISPFVGGQIVDRWLPTQIFLAITQLIGGVILISLAWITNFAVMGWVMLVYSLFYAPSLALSNSICFHHLKDTEKDFGAIRVWGSIGWLMAGWVLLLWWKFVQPLKADMFASDPAAYISTESILFVLAGVVSIFYGLFCFALPHTPPSKESSSPWAFLDAFKLFKDRNFAIFMFISFVVSTQLMFFFIQTPMLLESSLVGINPDNTSAVITTFCISTEILAMFVLMPWFLKRFGIGKTLALGVLAWPIRYAIFSLGTPWWLVVGSLLLHGLAYTFFFVVGQIYVDRVAPAHIKGSAQSLLTTVTFGLGMTISSIFSGWIQRIFTDTSVTPNVINFQGIFLVPCVLTVICTFAFLIFFKEPPKAPTENDATA